MKKQDFWGQVATQIVSSFSMEDPLSLKSTYYAFTRNKQKIWETNVKSLHSLYGKTQKGWMGLGEIWLENPLTSIVIGAGIGGFVGAASHGAKFYLLGKGLSKATTALTALEFGIGAGVVGYQARDIYGTMQKDPGMAFARVGMLGFQFAGAIAGYKGITKHPFKLGTQHVKGVNIRGLTIGERMFHKGFTKRINVLMSKSGKLYDGRTVYKSGFDMYGSPYKKMVALSPAQGQRILTYKNLELQMRAVYGGVETYGWQKQLGVDFGRVETFKGRGRLRDFWSRFSKKERTELFGGVSEKTETHDLDIMFRNLSRGIRRAEFGTKKLGYGDYKQYTDVKPFQKPGSVVGRAGTVKLPSYNIEGYNIMRWSESALRHGESGFELAHLGRLKDIDSAATMYARLHYQSGSPKLMQLVFKAFLESSLEMKQSPFVMGEIESSYIYSSTSFVERYASAKNWLYRTFLPKRVQLHFQEKAFGNIMSFGEPVKPTVSGIPSSPKIVVSNPFAGAITFFQPSISMRTSPSVSPSVSSPYKMSPFDVYRSISYKSFSPLFSISIQSPSSKSISSSISNSVSSISKSVSRSVSRSKSASSSASASSSSISPTPSTSYVYPPAPIPGLYGGGRGPPGGAVWGKQFRFREKKLPSFKEFFRIDKKTFLGGLM